MTGTARIAGGPDLAEDYHVHSTFSADGTSTIGENAAAADARGLRTICLAEHVRASSSWVPEFAAAAARLPRPRGLRILTGVEAKILDMTGRLDLPAGLDGIDVVLIADHQFPGDFGPEDPADLRQALAAGEASAEDAVECLTEATANAVSGQDAAVVAHMFSVLPKIGLSEDDVPDSRLSWLAGRISAAGAAVEINEKWRCPAERAVRALARAGVRLVAGSDSHYCGNVGVYRSVRQTVDAAFAGAAGR
jgi:putative hydrolase